MRSNEHRNGFRQRCGGSEARVGGSGSSLNYFEATVYFEATLPACAAASLSITARHPELRLERFLTMQAVMRGMLGISELHRRNASPVHICCASALKAKLADEDNAEKEAATARAKPAWRIVRLTNEVIGGSCLLAARGPFLMSRPCAQRPGETVTSITRQGSTLIFPVLRNLPVRRSRSGQENRCRNPASND